MSILLNETSFSRTCWLFVALLMPLSLVSVSAQACPDVSKNGAALSYTSDALYSAKSHSVIAGGGVNLDKCYTLPGYGQVSSAPDFTLRFSGNSNRDLELRLNTDCDSILLVNDVVRTQFL